MKRFVQKQIEYLRDNPEGYWFKAKCYGWGWTPATREGWLVTLGAVGGVLWLAIRFETGGYPEEAVLTMVLLPTIGIISALFVVCYITGERPHWHWGVPKDKSDEASDSQTPSL